MLERVAEGLHVARHPLRVLGVEFGTRMTVITLPDGGLWLHSPIPIDDALRSALDALGPVRHIVAPNLFHHLFLSPCQALYPDASLHVAPGFDRKRPDLKPDAVLGGALPEAWGDAIDAVLLEGMPALNETVFFHRPSRTLIVTDLVFNFGRPTGWAGLFCRLNGIYGKVTPSRVYRSAIKDKAAFGRSVGRLLEWDFERVVLAHGGPIEEAGKATLEPGLRPLVA